jgi:hypothetical protein
MKRTLTLVGFLIAGTAALSLGCQKRETTTTTTETTTTSDATPVPTEPMGGMADVTPTPVP